LNINEAALTIGTSGAVRVTIPKPAMQELNGLFMYPLTKKMYVTGGPTTMAVLHCNGLQKIFCKWKFQLTMI
jgi:hypothetical protein